METNAGIPLPEPSELTRPFWEGCRQGELRVQRCDDCGRRFFTPLPACPACLSRNWAWVASSGAGTLYSFTVVRRPARPDRPVPYVIGLIDLDEGWTMMSNVVDCDPDRLRCGARVAVRFQPLSDEIVLPMFALVEGASASAAAT